MKILFNFKHFHWFDKLDGFPCLKVLGVRGGVVLNMAARKITGFAGRRIGEITGGKDEGY